MSINLFPFNLDIDMQKKVLSKYNNPKDLIERSYFHYRVQFDVVPLYKRLLNNFVGFFAIIYFLIRGVITRSKSNFYKKSYDSKFAIFPYKNYHYPNVIPQEIENEFEIMKINFMEDFYFSRHDFGLLYQVFKRYPFDFYFLSKCISKVLFYRYIVAKFSPNAIITCSEYSFSSSIATNFCRKNNIEHINTMHGEKFFILKDTFFEFDRCYVWDDFYKDLFIKLKASPNQFIVGTFSNLQMNVDRGREIYNYTYYLAAETEAILFSIRNSLDDLDEMSNICIRIHPRYSDLNMINRIFSGFVIENAAEVTLEESFSRTKNVISLYSSCLIEAYFNNKPIIVDDCNHGSDRLHVLSESEYIILSKPHTLLSSLLTKEFQSE